ncbi:hypothetical protein OFB94_29225, partial [Escherichia coli]|nr:hypothetical protein [Escherichia coli]
SAAPTYPPGTVSSDASNNGTDPDPNGNGNPGDPGENTPTPITLPPQIVGIAKAVASVNQVGPGVFDVQYTLNLKNLGTVPATNVQITDDL